MSELDLATGIQLLLDEEYLGRQGEGVYGFRLVKDGSVFVISQRDLFSFVRYLDQDVKVRFLPQERITDREMVSVEGIPEDVLPSGVSEVRFSADKWRKLRADGYKRI